MPDICMCPGYKHKSPRLHVGVIIAPVSEEAANMLDACPLRFRCYRFTATPDRWRQSYFVEAPFKIEGADATSCCEHFTR